MEKCKHSWNIVAVLESTADKDSIVLESGCCVCGKKYYEEAKRKELDIDVD